MRVMEFAKVGRGRMMGEGAACGRARERQGCKEYGMEAFCLSLASAPYGPARKAW